jgi:carbon catabolite-derepressing protein kinase
MMSQSSRSGISGSGISARPYVSKVGILPSSIPTYHKDYMERRNAGGDHLAVPSNAGIDEPPSSRTEAERQEMARRLKPHSRSQLRLDEAAKRPQGMTPINPPKKPKPVRWQFGIRSRNAPWEALLTIHKALHKLGATYIPDEDFDPNQGKDESEPPSGDGSFAEDYVGNSAANSSTSVDPTKRYKLPADPWHIKVRWEVEGELIPQTYVKYLQLILCSASKQRRVPSGE